MNKFILSAILFLGLASCNEESLDSGISTQELNVTINEKSSRVGFENGTGNFFWTANDKIGVTTTTSATSFISMTLSSESGKSTGTFIGTMSGKPSGYAVYPYIEFRNHSITALGELTYKFPSEYTYSNLDSEYGSKTGNSFNAPMWAEIIEGEGVFFNHLGGVICVTVNNLPVGNNQKFILETTNQITGEFTADLTIDSPKLVTTASNTNNTVTINFSNSTEDGTGVFYVPVPTGTYDEIIAIVMNGEEEVGIGIWNNQVVNQGSLKKATIEGSSLEGGTAVVYNVQTAGTLKNLLPNDYLTMTSLKVNGYLNGTDIRLLQNMSKGNGSLTYLDLSESHIVAGGEDYDYYNTRDDSNECYTKDNVVSRHMFRNCKLETILLPNSATIIESGVLSGCTNLTSITIPRNIQSISFSYTSNGNPMTFQNTPLQEVNIDNNNTYLSISDGVLFNKEKTELIKYLFPSKENSSYTIPETVTNIGECAFLNCTNFTSINIPNTVTSIEKYAFQGCTNVTELTLSNNLNIIPERAFGDCGSKTDGISKLKIHEGVTRIYKEAFHYATIRELYLPSTLTDIDNLAFIAADRNYSKGINAIYCAAIKPPYFYDSYSEYWIGTNPSTCILYVPIGSKERYESSNYWPFTNIEEIEF